MTYIRNTETRRAIEICCKCLLSELAPSHTHSTPAAVNQLVAGSSPARGANFPQLIQRTTLIRFPDSSVDPQIKWVDGGAAEGGYPPKTVAAEELAPQTGSVPERRVNDS